MTETLLLLGSLALVLACGLFVAAEFSFVGVDRATVDREVERGDRSARGVLAALRSLSTQLSAAQLGITVTNLAIGFMSEPAIAALIDTPLSDLGLSEGAAAGVSLTIALIASTAVTMVLGELVPKNLAIATPLRTARWTQLPMRAFTTATRPLVALLNNTSNVLVRAVGVEPQEELASARSAEELFSLVRRSADQGTLPSGTAVLVQRSLSFTERHASDVMTPRGAIDALAPGDTVARLVETVAATGHSRFPVFEPGELSAARVVQLRDVLGVPHDERATTTVDTLARPVEAVPESVDLDALLTRLRDSDVQLAVVVDEYGDLAGLVTLEDLVEEIVGEVRDEHDPDATLTRGERLEDGSWRLEARMRPDEASTLLGWTVPESEDYDTLAGLVTEVLGRVPEEGDVAETALERPGEELGVLERARAVIRVESVEGWRVDSLLLTVTEDAPADEEVGTMRSQRS